MAARAAFETVKQRDERAFVVRAAALEPVEVDEVAVGRVPALAAIGNARSRRDERRMQGLQVAARQPGGRAVGSRQS